jgi:hypothetical protein
MLAFFRRHVFPDESVSGHIQIKAKIMDWTQSKLTKQLQCNAKCRMLVKLQLRRTCADLTYTIYFG